MTENNELLAALIGGFIGAAIASPNPVDKQALENYKAFQNQINLRTQKVPVNQNLLSQLGKKPEYYSAFIESYRSYSYGLFRSSVSVASALIESILREKFEGSFANLISEMISKERFKGKNFYELIEEAKKTKLIEGPDYHFLHGLRSQRNNSVHDVLKDVSELDAVTILNITIKIIWKLV
ncbi:MAG: hypothetical protein WC511_00890 [Candidatus Pacearchaeota archaeon]|jgi:hypothetical protein